MRKLLSALSVAAAIACTLFAPASASAKIKVAMVTSNRGSATNRSTT